jgi:hypothetical protein
MSGVGPTVFLLPSYVESRCGAYVGERGIVRHAGGRRPTQPAVLTDAGAGCGAAREEGSPAAPTVGRSRILSRAASGALLLPRGCALEVAVAEAPPVVQRSRCPERPPRGERGKGVGEAWPLARPLGVPLPPRRQCEPLEGGGWTEELKAGGIRWEGEGLLNVMRGRRKIVRPTSDMQGRCYVIENHHQNRRGTKNRRFR